MDLRVATQDLSVVPLEPEGASCIMQCDDRVDLCLNIAGVNWLIGQTLKDLA